MTEWKDPMMNYQDLKEEVRNTAQILLEENPENKEVVFKILNDIQSDDIEIPRELDVDGWDDNSITFTDGLILLTIAKQDDKFVSTIEGCWFGAKNEEPYQLPIPKKTESYENQFNAIAQTIIQRGDVVNRYYFPYGLVKIKNSEEICANPHYEEWHKIMFSKKGLCGLDFVDVYKAVKDKVCTLTHLSVEAVESLPNKLLLDEKVQNLIIAIKVPQNQGLDEINKIAEIFTEKVDGDCQVLWQSVEHDKKEFEIIILYN